MNHFLFLHIKKRIWIALLHRLKADASTLCCASTAGHIWDSAQLQTVLLAMTNLMGRGYLNVISPTSFIHQLEEKKRGILGLNDHEESLVLRGGWHNETELLYTHIKPWKYSFIRHSLDLCYTLGLLEPGSALTGWEAPNTSWHRHICWGYARTCLKICLFS